MATLRITYTLVEDHTLVSGVTYEHEIGDQSGIVIPAIRQAVEEIVDAAQVADGALLARLRMADEAFDPTPGTLMPGPPDA